MDVKFEGQCSLHFKASENTLKNNQNAHKLDTQNWQQSSSTFVAAKAQRKSKVNDKKRGGDESLRKCAETESLGQRSQKRAAFEFPSISGCRQRTPCRLGAV